MDEGSATAMPDWRLSARSVRGLSHEIGGQVNQDAAAEWSNAADGRPATLAMVAVADGHGSEVNFRSDRGARFAVETLTSVCESMAAMPDRLIAAATAEGGRQFAALLVRQWRERVEQDLAARPLTDAEFAGIPDDRTQERAHLAGDPAVSYGSTLLGVFATAGQLIYVQIGDGDLYTVDADGTARRPLGPADEADGEATDSLCTRDAADRLRVVVTPVDAPLPRFVFLGTDGYSKSYGDAAAFAGIVTDIHDRITSAGFDAVAEKMPDWLAAISKQGSSDDISVGMLYRPTPAAGAATDLGTPANDSSVERFD